LKDTSKLTSTLKTKTRQLRREHILQAAIRVFGAQGFRGATIRDVATEAGVSDGTIYNVFANKEELLIAILEPLLRASQSEAAVPSAAPDTADPASLLRAMIHDRWASLTPETLAMMRVIWSEALNNPALAQLYLDQIILPVLNAPQSVFRELAERGVIASANVAATLRIITAAFLGLALLKLLEDADLQQAPDAAASALADLILNGLLPRNPENRS
jgi:AcrR family transcriptional regulator